jgi:hypothetical protein
LNDYIRNGRSRHSTNFQEGSDNSKVEKAALYFHFDIFILGKKAAREKCN